ARTSPLFPYTTLFRSCRFLKQNNFLVGLSIDGPPYMHDRYRVDHAAASSSDRVLAALRKLRNHGVEHNLLCVLNDRNVRSPDERSEEHTSELQSRENL